MTYEAVLSAALELSAEDRLRLAGQLWDDLPEEVDPFTDEWKQEIERRVAEIKAGTVKTVPWSTIRERTRARLNHEQTS